MGTVEIIKVSTALSNFYAIPNQKIKDLIAREVMSLPEKKLNELRKKSIYQSMDTGKYFIA